MGGLFLWLELHFHRLAVAVIDLRHVHREGTEPARAIRPRPSLVLFEKGNQERIKGEFRAFSATAATLAKIGCDRVFVLFVYRLCSRSRRQARRPQPQQAVIIRGPCPKRAGKVSLFRRTMAR
jgi:hypothetical protein